MAGKQMKRCVLMTFPMFFQEISLIHSGLLEKILSKYTVVLLVPPEYQKKKGIEEFFKGKDVEVRIFPAQPLKESLPARMIKSMLYMKNRKRISGFLKRHYQAMDRGLRISKKIKRKIMILLSRLFSERLLEALLNRYFCLKECDELFAEYNPALLLTCHPGNFYCEGELLRSAKKMSLPAFAIDTTWDMLDSGWLPKFDKFFVWGGQMKTEALLRHNYREDSAIISGPLRFDFYKHKEFLIDKETFVRNLGLGPERKLVTIMASRAIEDEYFYVNLIRQILEWDVKGLTKKRIQIVLREKPDVDLAKYQVFQNNPLVALDRPFSINNPSSIIQREELINLMNLLKHSDIIISVYSTLVLEACYFDTPLITLNFDSSQWFVERDFVQYLLAGDGTWVVRNQEELLKAINGYLENPRLKQEGRRRMLNDLCAGGACDAADIIMKEIEDSLKD